MGKYKFIQFGYYQLSAEHIPFLVYSIVQGPRGGNYLLDEFNTDKLLQYIAIGVHPAIISSSKNNIIRGMGKDSIVRIVYEEYTEKDLALLAKESRAKYLSRKDGLKVTRNIASLIEDNQKQYITERFEYKQYEFNYGLN